jgi:alkanesulfonate monooxygenase SsuD/methylene tetrahydromethanopterin reductase-like flavin-dependent oxidoreductase (luciferase family)
VQAIAARMSIAPEEARGRMLAGTVRDVIRQIEAFVAVGVTHFIVMLAPPYDLEALEAFARGVMPHFRI